MINCQYCGAPNKGDALECHKCGGPPRTVYMQAARDFAHVPTDAAMVSPWPVQGNDLSFWQGAVNFQTLAHRSQFVILRYAFGNTGIDGQVANYYPAAVGAGLAVMAYHYVKVGKNIDKHVETFAGLLKDYPALYAWVDVEENADNLSKAAYENWLLKYVNRLEDAIGQEVGIYTSAGMWNKFMPLTAWAKHRKLWVAHWTTAPEPLLPNEWIAINNPRTWTLWQHSSRGSGAAYGASSEFIDQDRYQGGVLDFNLEFGASIEPLPGEPEPPPEPPPSEYPKAVRVTAQVGLNVRATPGGTDIGTLARGTDVTVDGEDGDWLHMRDGWIHGGYVVEI